jgi:hypothetical protein
MPPLAQEETAARLLHLAKIGVQDFGKFPAERELVYKTTIGSPAVLGDDLPRLSERDNVDTGPRFWRHDREIRAALIRWLCVNPEAKKLIGTDGIRLLGASIIGDLNLNYAEIPFPASFVGCRLKGTTSLVACQIPMLALTGSWTGAIVAHGAKIKYSLFLDGGFRSEGTVSLLGTPSAEHASISLRREP